jgi:predicted nucleic acid-binding protein
LIFIDTTFWVGDADLNDDFHEAARTAIEALRSGGTALGLTTDFVLDETVTILGKRKGFGAQKAAKVADHILASPRVFAVYIDESLFRQALRLYPAWRGKLSLTDVTSVAVMKMYGVTNIFSHDRDFDEVEGITRSVSP